MVYFVTDRSTYHAVTRKSVHAVASLPVELSVDQFVLLAEKRDPKSTLHKQIQWVAKVLSVRQPAPGELEHLWPGKAEQHDWKWLIELYWSAELDHKFNMFEVKGIDYAQYRNVQTAKVLPEADQRAMLDFLCETNPAVVRDFISRALPEERRATR